MTHAEALAEARRRRADDPTATWIATRREDDWVVARLGITPQRVTGTALRPPPQAPAFEEPGSPVTRAARIAGFC